MEVSVQMTRIASRKTAMRAETNALYRGRPLCITVEPHDVIIRERGRRSAFAIPWLAVYELGFKLAATEARKLKLEKRKARRSK
jgi:hypothetical protein